VFRDSGGRGLRERIYGVMLGYVGPRRELWEFGRMLERGSKVLDDERDYGVLGQRYAVGQ
jgi:hypothetical protein